MNELLRDTPRRDAECVDMEEGRREIPVRAAAFNPVLESPDYVEETNQILPPATVATAYRTAEVVERQPEQFPVVEPVTGVEPATTAGAAGTLFPDQELTDFRSRWDKVQVSFVDEPRQAVQQADSLVANVVKRIEEQFSAQRSILEGQWEKGQEVSTEDLRQALKRYRSLFERLLTVRAA